MTLICLSFLLLDGLFDVLFKENGLIRLTGEFGFLQQRQDYSFLNLVKSTAVGGFWIILSGGLFFISNRLKSGVRSHFWILDLGILLIGIVFYLTFILSEWSHGTLLITFAFICWQLRSISPTVFKSNDRFFTMILILLPFLLHLGSNVYWMRLGNHYKSILAFSFGNIDSITNFNLSYSLFCYSFLFIFSGILIWDLV